MEEVARKKKKNRTADAITGWDRVREKAVAFHSLSGVSSRNLSVAECEELEKSRRYLLEHGLTACYDRFVRPVEEAFSDAMFDVDERWHGKMTRGKAESIDYFGKVRKKALELKLTDLTLHADDPATLMVLLSEADSKSDYFMGIITELKPMEESLQNLVSLSEKQIRALLPITAETAAQSLALFALSPNTYRILSSLHNAVAAVEMALKRIASRKQVLGNIISLLPGANPSWRHKQTLENSDAAEEIQDHDEPRQQKKRRKSVSMQPRLQKNGS